MRRERTAAWWLAAALVAAPAWSAAAQTEGGASADDATAEADDAAGAEGEASTEGSASAEGDPAAEGEDYDPRQMRTEGLDDEAARSRFRVGQTLYDEGRFLEAAREFERAFELSQRASLLFNAYLAYRDAGQLADGVRTLDAYLTNAPDVADAEPLRHRLEAMRETLAEQREREAAEEAERQALQEERERLAREAEEARRRAELAEAEGGVSPVGIVVGGVGVGMLAGGLVSGLLANGQFDDIEAACPDQRCVVGFDLEGERATQDRLNRTTDVLLFGGAAVTLTGLVLLFVLDPAADDDDDADAPASASASCGPTGCRADLTVEF